LIGIGEIAVPILDLVTVRLIAVGMFGSLVLTVPGEGSVVFGDPHLVCVPTSACPNLELVAICVDAVCDIEALVSKDLERPNGKFAVWN